MQANSKKKYQEDSIFLKRKSPEYMKPVTEDKNSIQKTSYRRQEQYLEDKLQEPKSYSEWLVLIRRHSKGIGQLQLNSQMNSLMFLSQGFTPGDQRRALHSFQVTGEPAWHGADIIPEHGSQCFFSLMNRDRI
ncbi:hypothetical protein TNCV_2925901 [Trichonephila clavipes]|nr:hypothetical protein TNCV_2925901 [Trichonephila clavipes]